MSKDSRIIHSKVAKTAKIFDNCLIRDSIIGEHALCADNVVVDRSELKEHVEIGRRTYVQDSSFDYGSYIGQNSIVKFTHIGKFNSISWNLSIGGFNHNYHSANMYTSYWWKKVFDVNVPDHNKGLYGNIGNATWIGAGVNIFRGVQIGDGAVIGDGALVNKNIPPFAIVTGAPAKIIKYRFSDEIISDLLDIRWWEWPKKIIKENATLLNDDLTLEIIENLKEINDKFVVTNKR